MAPPGTRPTVTTFFDTDPAAPPAANPPTMTGPWATAYTPPSAPLRGTWRRVPPWRLLASPMVLTVTSIFCPGRAKAGRSAVMVTTATFRLFTALSFRVTPNWLMRFRIIWVAMVPLSPVP